MSDLFSHYVRLETAISSDGPRVTVTVRLNNCVPNDEESVGIGSATSDSIVAASRQAIENAIDSLRAMDAMLQSQKERFIK